MRKEFVMRGTTDSAGTEILNFGKYKQGYAYRMTEFVLYPSTNIGVQAYELCATVTAAKVPETPDNPRFHNEGLIATALMTGHNNPAYSHESVSVVNDTFIITQNLVLAVLDTYPGSPMPVNWQCRFESVKMSGPEEAAVNYKQFSISN